MDKLIGLVASPTQSAAPLVAAQALTRAAQKRGASFALETRSALGVQNPLTQEQIDGAHAVLIAADGDHALEAAAFAGKPVYRVSLDEAIREADGVFARAMDGAAAASAKGSPASAAAHATGGTPAKDAAAAQKSGPLKIVAITSCPTGIAHTFMAAEGLAQGAKALGHEIHVETQGSVGAQNALTPAQIAAADLVVKKEVYYGRV